MVQIHPHRSLGPLMILIFLYLLQVFAGNFVRTTVSKSTLIIYDGRTLCEAGKE
jgi:hypothetical protein